MSEHGGRDDHFGVITAAENFQVRATGQRGTNCQTQFTRFQFRRGNILDPEILLSVEHSSTHVL